MHTTNQPTETIELNNNNVSTVLNSDTKPVRKAGRTLLVKSRSGLIINSSIFDSLTGLQSKTETKSTHSFFLTFDTVSNAQKATTDLQSSSSDYNIKYSYYRVFFTMTGLVETTDYNLVKTQLCDLVSQQTGSSVLYCKLYRKDLKYIGCGDITLDTLSGMTLLLSKESGYKTFSFDTFTGSFYRYNGKKEKPVLKHVDTTN